MPAQQFPATVNRELGHNHDAHIFGADASFTQQPQDRTERPPRGEDIIHHQDGRAFGNRVPVHLDPRLRVMIGCRRRDMRRGLDDGHGGRGQLAGLADQRQGHVDPRGQRRRIDEAAGLTARHHVDRGPPAGEVASQQGHAQAQPPPAAGRCRARGGTRCPGAESPGPGAP
ncbi:hypothetical protein VTK56DRAFT_4389 [Thermocarpiscus australiensis]